MYFKLYTYFKLVFGKIKILRKSIDKPKEKW